MYKLHALLLFSYLAGKKTKEQGKGKKKQLPPAADVTVKHKNVVNEDFTLARLKKMQLGMFDIYYRVDQFFF